MSDESEAAREITRATGQGIDLLGRVGHFLSLYLAEPLEQASGIFTDHLRFARWKRALRLMDRAETLLAGRGLSSPTRVVPLKLAVSIVEAGSLEEDDDLQDRFAALLVNAGDAGCTTTVRCAFVRILDDLSPLDARILDTLYGLGGSGEIVFSIATRYLPERAVVEEPHERDKSISLSNEVEVALSNLARLELIGTGMTWAGARSLTHVHQTRLGREFTMACRKER